MLLGKDVLFRLLFSQLCSFTPFFSDCILFPVFSPRISYRIAYRSVGNSRVDRGTFVYFRSLLSFRSTRISSTNT